MITIVTKTERETILGNLLGNMDFLKFKLHLDCDYNYYQQQVLCLNFYLFSD